MVMSRRHAAGLVMVLSIASLAGCRKDSSAGSLVVLALSRSTAISDQATVDINLDGTDVEQLAADQIPPGPVPLERGYWIGRIASQVEVKVTATMGGVPVGSAQKSWQGATLSLEITPITSGSGGAGGGGVSGTGGLDAGSGSGGSGSGGAGPDGGGAGGRDGSMGGAGGVVGAGGSGVGGAGVGGAGGRLDGGGPGGASPDGSAGDAGDARDGGMTDCSPIVVTPTYDCDTYCAAVAAAPNCLLYQSAADCKATCLSFGWKGPSSSANAMENTLQCRMSTIGDDCDYGGAKGGGYCPFSPCTVYCDALKKNCTGAVPAADITHCMADCTAGVTWTDSDLLTNRGNTGECFIYWAAFAGRPEESANIAADCSNADLHSSTVCVP
jgi:hypothetical protein